ncbi:MAG TPA: septum formation initiator family protein [Candidatus Saccharimonadales bacterium]|nr:septum formation initiator family protein [Candidatus Saccharimonadales bacterium]
MFEKIKIFIKHPFVLQFRDPRAIGLTVFGVIAVLVTWSGIKSVQSNYDLQKQIAQLQQENQVKELENKNLYLQNQYLNTDQFLELSARKQFGLAAPGEKVLIVPKNVALAHTVDIADPNTVTPKKAGVQKPAYQRNFQAWMDFFLHRSSSGD